MLREKGLWEFVSTDGDISDVARASTDVKKRETALAYTLMSIDASCKPTIVTLRDPWEIWGKLRCTYQASSEASIDAKFTKLQQVKTDRKEHFIQYSNRIKNVVNDLSAAGHVATDLEKKRALLRRPRDEFTVIGQVTRTIVDLLLKYDIFEQRSSYWANTESFLWLLRAEYDVSVWREVENGEVGEMMM